MIQRLLLVFTHYENVSGNMFVVKNTKELLLNQPLEIGVGFFCLRQSVKTVKRKGVFIWDCG